MTADHDPDATLTAEEAPQTLRGRSVGPGDLVDARYRLERMLGQGGMGEVWAAEHVALQRPVALKLLRTAEIATGQQRERFLREARIISAIRHPNVVGVTDFGELPDGTPFIAMDLIEGRTLTELVAQDGALPWPRAVVLLQQIASALSQTHRQGVVHRDLKPDNVLVSAEPSEHATVIDFGIAGRVALDPKTTKLTKTGKVFGTPGYMAPEQIRGEPADARSDIYALGCVAFELLTGARVFSGGLFERMEAHLYRAPPPLPSVLPTGVVRLVERCLAKPADERVATMDEVFAALERCTGREQKRTVARAHVPAAPPGASTPSGRPTAPAITLQSTAELAPPLTPPANRRGWLVAAISAAAGLATLGVLYAAWDRTPQTARPDPDPAPSPAPQPAKAPSPAPVPVPVAAPEPEPETEPAPEPPEPAPDPRSTTGPKTGTKTKRKPARQREPEPAPIETPPKRTDGTFDLFAEPKSEPAAKGQ